MFLAVRVLEDDINLRSVERPIPFVDAPFSPNMLKSRLQLLFGLIPVLSGPNEVVCWPG